MTEHVRVRGADNVARTLRACARDLEDMAPAGRSAAELVARQAAQNAPRSSGALAASIRPASTASTATITAGGGLLYAGVQEGGWARRNIRPRLYMRRAIESRTNDVVATYVSAVEKAAGKIKGV